MGDIGALDRDRYVDPLCILSNTSIPCTVTTRIYDVCLEQHDRPKLCIKLT
jgi:hypothetical protein